jgi:hypothetical protein
MPKGLDELNATITAHKTEEEKLANAIDDQQKILNKIRKKRRK